MRTNLILDGGSNPVIDFLRHLARLQTEEEMEAAGGEMAMEDAFATVNELIEQARELAARFDRIVHATDADVLLEELVQQLDGIGIPDWRGAEGLALEGSRAYLAGPARKTAKDEAHRRRLVVEAGAQDHDDWTRAEWREDVARGDTWRGYGEWVVANRQQEFEENCAAGLHVVVIPRVPADSPAA